MIVVSDNNVALYDSIKKRLCVGRAIPAQVLKLKTSAQKHGNTRGLMNVATKVVMQLNCKLGAVPLPAELPLTGLMVVGYKTLDDPNQKGVTLGTLVTSMDIHESATYFAAVSPHRNASEMTSNLILNMIKALTVYWTRHNCLPQKILFYRDGVVGEENEINKMVEKVRALYQQNGKKLLIAVVGVTKRHNYKRGDMSSLPEHYYDFYLIPQSIRQGTVNPTAYIVKYNTLGCTPFGMQKSTNKMCHLYYNWTGG